MPRFVINFSPGDLSCWSAPGRASQIVQRDKRRRISPAIARKPVPTSNSDLGSGISIGAEHVLAIVQLTEPGCTRLHLIIGVGAVAGSMKSGVFVSPRVTP